MMKRREYTFIHDYKENETLRKSFNELTKKTWSFDFEPWFQSGYWDDSCHLYSLMDDDKMVSHVTISTFNAVILGERKILAQLGTVMTDEAYRKRGLNKMLMEKVLNDWLGKCDFIYLFANESVLDFYPKFGFSAVEEYEAVRTVNSKQELSKIRKMNVDEKEDLALLDRLGRNAVPLFDLSIINNIGTIMFYCLAADIFKNNLYYLEELDVIAVAEYEGLDVIVHDILSSQEVDVDLVLDSLANTETKNIRTRFTPKDKANFTIRKFKDEDLTLFVSSESKKLFENNEFIFPTLSHT